MLMLDTSVAIHVRDSDPATLARLAEVDRAVCLSIVTQVELEGGVVKAPATAARRRRALDRMLLAYPSVPFGEADVAAYRTIVEQLGFSRPVLLDRMIAAQAIVANATLATLNPRDFRDIPGLAIEDWSS